MGKPSRGTNYISGTKRGETIDQRHRSEDLTIDAKAGNDIVYGGSGADTIFGAAGDDTIYGSPFDKLIDGGPGTDTLSFETFVFADGQPGQGVDARLFGGTIGISFGPDAMPVLYGSVTGVENLIGSIYADHLMGNGFVNRLDGGAGDDWLSPVGSGDFITGGPGADTFSLENAHSSFTIIDFDYDAGDRLYSPSPVTSISWQSGTGQDASGITRSAWIGTYTDYTGNVEQVILLGDTQPQPSWLVTG